MIRKRNHSVNVYADLGLTDADEMLIKAQLASTISAIIKRRRKAGFPFAQDGHM